MSELVQHIVRETLVQHIVRETNALRDAIAAAEITARRSCNLAAKSWGCFSRRTLHERRFDAAVTVIITLGPELRKYRERVANACAPWFEVQS
jgi:hypothetical protein